MERENNNNLPDSVVHFETAIDRAGFGSYSYQITALTGLSIISYACVIYASSIVVPLNHCELETTATQQSLLIAMPLVATIGGAVLWGWLGDTRGRRSMLLVSFSSGAVVMAAATFSVNWIMLMIFQFAAALLASGQYSLAMTLLSESVPAGKRNTVVLVVASIFLLTQGIMSMIALPIVQADFHHWMSTLGIFWNPWRTTLLIYCVPSLICCLWIFFLEESPKFCLSKGDEDKAIQILKIIHRKNNRNSKEELQVKGLISETPVAVKEGQSNKPVMELFRKPLLRNFALITMLAVFLKISVFMVWVPTIVNNFMSAFSDGGYEAVKDLTVCGVLDSQKDEDTADPTCSMNQTGLLIIFGISCLQSLTNLALSFVVARLGRRNTYICVAALCGASGILVNVVPNAIGSAVLFVLFLMAMVLPGIKTAMTVSLFPTHLRASAVALTMTGGRLALIANTVILGNLIHDYCSLSFYIYCAIFASSAVIASFLPDDRKIQTLLKVEDPSEPTTKEIEDDKGQSRSAL